MNSNPAVEKFLSLDLDRKEGRKKAGNGSDVSVGSFISGIVFVRGCRLDRRGRLDARARERTRSCSSSVWCVAAQVCRCRPVHVGEKV